MIRCSPACLLVLVAAVAGCDGGDGSGGGGEGYPVDSPGASASVTVESLQEKAVELASRDLERLNAAEMMYRNRVYAHHYLLGDIQRVAYAKLYRHFTDFDVKDIRRSDSLLRPYAIDLEYRFDYVGTEGIVGNYQDLESVEKVKNDFHFRVLGENVLRRLYFCDASGACYLNGELAEEASEALERPNYWTLGEGSSLGSGFVRPVYGPGG